MNTSKNRREHSSRWNFQSCKKLSVHNPHVKLADPTADHKNSGKHTDGQTMIVFMNDCKTWAHVKTGEKIIPGETSNLVRIYLCS